MTVAYLGLGSNLAEPKQQLTAAIAALTALPQTTEVTSSPWYRSRPMGPQDQPDYVNAVVALDTGLSPEQLLAHTQAIEQAQGRVRSGERWGPRTLDIDILLFGQRVIASQALTIPHYGMAEREFVLLPLYNLAGDIELPSGTSLKDLLSALGPSQLETVYHPEGDWQYPIKSV